LKVFLIIAPAPNKLLPPKSLIDEQIEKSEVAFSTYQSPARKFSSTQFSSCLYQIAHSFSRLLLQTAQFLGQDLIEMKKSLNPQDSSLASWSKEEVMIMVMVGKLCGMVIETNSFFSTKMVPFSPQSCDPSESAKY
jgi:hypothetical protein